MCKMNLLEGSVHSPEAIEAKSWADWLVLRESRGPGDMPNAMRRLSSRYGIDYGVFWCMRYRLPSDVLANVYHRLRNAYEAEHERQLRLLKHDIEITRRKTGTHHPAVAQAEAVVGKDHGEVIG